MFHDKRFTAIMAQDAFEESSHPRDHGKFSSGAGSSGSEKPNYAEKFKGYKSKRMGSSWETHAEHAPEIAARYEEALGSSNNPFEQRKAVLKVKKAMFNEPETRLGHAEGMADIILGHHKANYGAGPAPTAKEAQVKRMVRYLKQKPAGRL